MSDGLVPGILHAGTSPSESIGASGLTMRYAVSEFQ
jgi:hypothetical protein